MENDRRARELLQLVAADAPRLPVALADAVRSASRRRARRRLVAVAVTSVATITALGAVAGSALLSEPSRQVRATVAAPAPSSAATPAAACRHTLPSAPPSPAADLARASEVLGNLWRVYAPPDTSVKSPDGLPPGLRHGIIGHFGDSRHGFTLVVDPALRDPHQVRAELAAKLDPSALPSIKVEASCSSSRRLVEAWEAVSAKGWYPPGRDITHSYHLDVSTETIEVSLDHRHAGPETITALEATAPGIITVKDGRARRM